MDLPATNYSQLRSLIAGSRRAERWQKFDGMYRPIVLAWCQRRGLQVSDASDVTQEVFLKMPDKIATFDESKAKFRSWLKTVVHNSATDFYRRRAKEPQWDAGGSTALHEMLQNLAADDAIDELSTALEGRDESLAKEVCDRVRAQVDEKSWQIYWALVMENRPPSEVAKEAGILTTSVYKTKDRITKRLDEEYFNVFGKAAREPLS